MRTMPKTLLLSAATLIATSTVDAVPSDWEALAAMPPDIFLQQLLKHCKKRLGLRLTQQSLGKLDLEYRYGAFGPIAMYLSRHENPDIPGCKQSYSAMILKLRNDWILLFPAYEDLGGAIVTLLETATEQFFDMKSDGVVEPTATFKKTFASMAEFEQSLKTKIRETADIFSRNENDPVMKKLGKLLIATK